MNTRPTSVKSDHGERRRATWPSSSVGPPIQCTLYERRRGENKMALLPFSFLRAKLIRHQSEPRQGAALNLSLLLNNRVEDHELCYSSFVPLTYRNGKVPLPCPSTHPRVILYCHSNEAWIERTTGGLACWCLLHAAGDKGATELRMVASRWKDAIRLFRECVDTVEWSTEVSSLNSCFLDGNRQK